MQEANRDLLVLSGTANLSPKEFERQMKWLNRILLSCETWEIFCMANELLDINRHRIIGKSHHIQAVLSNPKLKPFVFISNKN